MGRKTSRWSILLLVTALAACREERKPPGPAATAVTPLGPAPSAVGSGSGRGPGSIPAVRARPPAGEVRLPIVASKVELVGNQAMREVTIGADGTVRFGEREVGVLTADGRFSQGGRLIAELDADGLVHVPAQPPGKTIRVDPDGTVLVDDDVVWAIGEDGQIHSRGKDGVLTNDGLAVFDGPPESRRAIALLMALQLMSRPSASATTTTSSAPPAPAPVPRIP